MHRFATSVVTIVLLAACSGGQEEVAGTGAPFVTEPVVTTATYPVSTEPEATEPEQPAGTFAAFDPPPSGQTWMQVSDTGGAVLNEEPELCLIVNDGETGRIETTNFGLYWADGEWTLTWLRAGSTFSGPVEGAVDGLTVTFEGEFEGTAVQGSVTCVEP